MRQFRIKTRWGITSVSFSFTHLFPDLHHIHENSAETLGPKYSIVNLIKAMIIPMPISLSGSKMNTFVNSHAFGIIRKLDVNQYIFPYTFNQNYAMICELFSQSSFLKGLSHK